MRRHLAEWRTIYILLSCCALLLGVLFFFVGRWHQQWEQWCHAQGGHVDSSTSTSTVVTVGGNGQPAVGTASSTTYYCLSSDGRILDVQS